MTWEYQIYLREHSAVFKYTKEKWGIFSNFYPEVLQVNGHVFPTSEHLYQAMKYPSYPQIQGEIMASITARKAKNTSRFHAQHQRPDWFEVNNKVMLWVIQIKLLQVPDLSIALRESAPLDIVESSNHDDYWGAKDFGPSLQGRNVLGRLLKAQRENLDATLNAKKIDPLDIPSFYLFGRPILEVVMA